MRFENSRGQAALEYLMILGFVLVLVIPFVYYGYLSSQESMRMMQASNAVDELRKAADYVWTQGTGSRTTVQVILPGGINFEKSYIGALNDTSGREINLNVQTSAGETDVWAETKGKVRGFFLNRSGTYLFTVFMMRDEAIYITPFGLEFDVAPTSFRFDLGAGNSSGINFTIKNYLNNTLSINLTQTGDIATWITLSTYNLTLAPYASASVSSTVTVPADAPPGLNTGTVLVQTPNSTQQVSLEVNVFTAGNVTILGAACNASRIDISTFLSASYGLPRYIYGPGETVYISGGNWNANSTITLTLRDPSNATVSGYPKNLPTNATGHFTDSWQTAAVAAGAYTLYANQSTANATMSFTVEPCTG